MTSAQETSRLERSIDRYPAYVFFQKASYWGPIFYLYFSTRLTLSDVLLLETIYYLSVVVLEVPTGYLSDRIGHRRVLIAGSVSQCLACIAFTITGHFTTLAVGQVLLALGMAFCSGSDTAYHYSILSALGRDKEYGHRESTSARALLISQAASALIGGAIASFDLRLAYALTFVSSGIAALIAIGFSSAQSVNDRHGTMLDQVGACLRDAVHPKLAWLTGYFVFMTILNHIPHEFYQPFLRDLIAHSEVNVSTPSVTGIHTAVTMVLATVAAGYSIRIRDRFGTSATLLLASLIQCLMIAGMAFAASPAFAIALTLRSTPRGLMQAPLNAEVVPLLGEDRRATYLSIQSLLGRLAFGVVLLTISTQFAGNEIAAPLRVSAIGAAIGLALLIVFLPISKRSN
jgi:MFS family permease